MDVEIDSPADLTTALKTEIERDDRDVSDTDLSEVKSITKFRRYLKFSMTKIGSKNRKKMTNEDDIVGMLESRGERSNISLKKNWKGFMFSPFVLLASSTSLEQPSKPIEARDLAAA